MENLIFIGFSNSENLMRGFTSWKGEYYDKIINGSDFSDTNTHKGVAYYCGKGGMTKKAVDLHITSINKNGSALTIKYDVLENLDYDSGAVLTTIKDIMNIEQGKYPPFCVCLKERDFKEVIEDEAILVRLRKLASGNDWQKIYKLYSPISQIKTLPQYWNSHKLLNAISFATAKLSESYVPLKKICNSNEEKEKYLNEKKQLREETILLRQRCIELDPDNAGYYSNLAYSYYQFCRELALPGGRRDGDIRANAEKAIEQIKNALDLDPNRITDNYRLGLILTTILSPMIQFKSREADAFRQAKERVMEGIGYLKLVVEKYEIIPLIMEKSLIRYKKEYVKALYNIANSYSDLAIVNFSHIQYCSGEQGTSAQDSYADEKNNYLAEALKHIEKCIIKDNNKTEKNLNKPDIFDAGRFNGAIDGAFKLYLKGKIHLKKYILMKNEADGQYAIRFLKESLYFRFSPEKQKQNKAFIAEKLARVLLIYGKYDEAEKCLNKFITDYSDYYIRYTYAVILKNLGRYEEAKSQIEKSLMNEKSNKDIATGKQILEIINKIK